MSPCYRPDKAQVSDKHVMSKWEKREIVWKHDATMVFTIVFTKFRIFQISTLVSRSQTGIKLYSRPSAVQKNTCVWPTS